MPDRSDNTDKVELRVRGKAAVDVPPDYAELSVSATFAHPSDRHAALAAASAAAERLRQAVAAMGPDGPVGVEVHLSSVTVRPVRRWVGETEVDEGFRASVSGKVHCVADDAGDVAAVIVAADVALNSVWWRLAAENPAYRHVRALAVADAERAADDFADALGRPRGEIVMLSDPGLGVGRETASLGGVRPRAAGAGTPEPVDLDPTAVHVSASVEATYLA